MAFMEEVMVSKFVTEETAGNVYFFAPNHYDLLARESAWR